MVEVCSVCFSTASFQLFQCTKQNCKTAAGKSCLASTEISIAEKRDLVPSGRAPPPQLGNVQVNLCMLRIPRDGIHFPVALGCFCISLQHKQSCILTDRLNIVEETVPVLLSCK